LGIDECSDCTFLQMCASSPPCSGCIDEDAIGLFPAHVLLARHGHCITSLTRRGCGCCITLLTGCGCCVALLAGCGCCVVLSAGHGRCVASSTRHGCCVMLSAGRGRCIVLSAGRGHYVVSSAACLCLCESGGQSGESSIACS
jgi:hypothetical protein